MKDLIKIPKSEQQGQRQQRLDFTWDKDNE